MWFLWLLAGGAVGALGVGAACRGSGKRVSAAAPTPTNNVDRIEEASAFFKKAKGALRGRGSVADRCSEANHLSARALIRLPSSYAALDEDTARRATKIHRDVSSFRRQLERGRCRNT